MSFFSLFLFFSLCDYTIMIIKLYGVIEAEEQHC